MFDGLIGWLIYWLTDWLLPFQLEDCALQLYKYNGNQGDYGSYLDLESTLDEQTDELDGFSER